MNVDNLFKETTKIGSFEFNEDVSNVFDDMVHRSVPGYNEIQSLISRIFSKFSSKKIFIDVGCSTGNTAFNILSNNEVIYGYAIDTSQPMLEICSKKCQAFNDKIECLNFDFLGIKHLDLSCERQPDFIILNLVLQFIRPPKRINFIKKIKETCGPNTTLILVEKILINNKDLNDRFVDMYYQWKSENGYSNTEIENKRAALDNKLIPFYHEENISMIKSAGFENIEIFYSNMNFRGYLCF